MPVELVMPKLGMTMTEGTLAEWLVPDGAVVSAGQPVFRLTTEKVDTEADASGSGTLHQLVGAGAVVPSGQAVGWILAAGEVAPGPAGAGPSSPADPSSPAGGPSGPAVGGGGPGRRGGRVNASPLARRMAEVEGIDLGRLAGSGPGGRIVAEDVRLAVEGEAGGEPGAPAAPPAPEGSGATRVGLSPMRWVIAQRMHTSLAQMAQLTIGMDVRMDDAARLRDQLRAAWGPGTHVTYTDLVARATVLALAEHPALNSSLDGDEQVIHGRVDLGVAVALPGGLVVPVVRDAGGLPLRVLSARIAGLAEAAGRGGLGPDDMQGSTFTVTSLGAQGVDFFTPIVNPPNVAILGVGRVRDGVVFEDDRPARALLLTLSLTFDHRAVDGVPAAEFLAGVKLRLETPLTLLT